MLSRVLSIFIFFILIQLYQTVKRIKLMHDEYEIFVIDVCKAILKQDRVDGYTIVKVDTSKVKKLLDGIIGD